MLFNNKEHFLYVEINNESIVKLKKESSKYDVYETGGLLWGKYSDDNRMAIITDATGAPDDSIHELCGFERGIYGVKELIDKKWENGDRILGNWHSHPYNSPEPSDLDDQTLHKDSMNEKLNLPEPVLIIIGGNKHYGFKMSVQVYKNGIKIPMVEDYNRTKYPIIGMV